MKTALVTSFCLVMAAAGCSKKPTYEDRKAAWEAQKQQQVLIQEALAKQQEQAQKREQLEVLKHVFDAALQAELLKSAQRQSQPFYQPNYPQMPALRTNGGIGAWAPNKSCPRCGTVTMSHASICPGCGQAFGFR